jgi:glycerol-3-phosphate dehydrogenase (NAD(P)+)
MARIGIVGAGAWGTTLALVTARNGHRVVLWAHDPEVADGLARRSENSRYLPGVMVPDAVVPTTRLAEAAKGAELVLAVTPAQNARAALAALQPDMAPGTPLLLCSKGIEIGTLALMTEIAAEAMPGRPVAVLSGPTFAVEVARGLPTAVTVAAADLALAGRVAALIGTARFRPYLSDDPVGAEIGGAVKNVLAIACGIVAGRGLGDNARAALITRGLAEIVRLAVARGAKPSTLMGLAGLGDIALTCTAHQSRNYSLGEELGRGRKLADLLARRRTVAEGVPTAAAVAALAERLGVEMPIAQAVDGILHHGLEIDGAIADLLQRPFRLEDPTGAAGAGSNDPAPLR